MNTKKKKGNGEGSVYKTKYGYRGQIVVGINDDGKPIRRSVAGKSIKEVNDKLTTIKNSLITGSYISPNKITVCELARIILEDEFNLNYVKESTYFRNIETVKRLEKDPYIKNTPIQELCYTQVKKYLLSETRMSQSLINKVYNMLQKTIREAIKRRIISENPIADLKKPKTSKKAVKVRALTTGEEMKLYKVLTSEDIKYSQQMLLSMLTGMRMGEINALSPKDINLNFKIISIDKTIAQDLQGGAFISESPKTENGKRVIPISDTVMPLVREILKCKANDERIFMDKGKLLTTNRINHQFQRIMEEYHIIDPNVKGKVSLHSLRHTFATRCIEAGMQAKVLQHLLGHSDISVTLNTYCDAFENYQKENIAKADEYFAKLGIKYDFDDVELAEA